MSDLNRIETFLKHKRLAMVGVSRDPRDFSRVVFRELLQRQYDVVPVNPAATSIEDRTCYALLQEIQPPVEAALILTPPEVTEDVVHECVAAGVKSIWLHRAVGVGAVSQNALSYCKEHHIEVVAGYCPLMFLPNTGFIHRVHRFFSKLSGRYPK